MGLLFVLRESRARQPLLPLRLFRSASLSAGTVLVVLLMFAMFGAMFFMTFYLENSRGLDPIGAGVHLLPMTAMLIVGTSNTPPQLASAITHVSHATFVGGMHSAFLVAAAVALAGAVIALITRRGHGAAEAHPAI